MVCCNLKLFFATDVIAETDGEPGALEIRNERALFVFNRVQNKLTGEFYLSNGSCTLLTSACRARL